MTGKGRQERCQTEGLVREVLHAPGAPLDPDLRLLMERRFGQNFAHVRLHGGEQAARSARQLGAQAYTAGSHIVLGEGSRRRQTRAGLWLLAHELAHVVQQASEFSIESFMIGDADDPLERAADRAADLVAAGSCLPATFAFGVVPAGVILRHRDIACPGFIVTPYEPKRKGIGGNWAIETAYKEDHPKEAQAEALFFGSQYEGERFGADVLLPRGAPNKAFGNMLLSRLRGLQNQRRPDIIDFANRVFYEIKTPRFADDGMVQLESYYKIANEVIHEYARFHEPEWKRSRATWYPRHVLPYPGDWRAIVCTQETDHSRRPGLILYDIRRRPDRRRDAEDQAVRAFDTVRIDDDFAALGPRLRNELRKQIRFYDPADPRYVIIMPREIYKKWPHKQNPLWEKLRVQPPLADTPGGAYVRSVKWELLKVAVIITVVGIVCLIVIAGAFLIYLIPAAAVLAAEGTAAVAVEEAEVISLSAYRAAKAAAAVQNLAKAAGVLFVVGTINNADAANPIVTSAEAIRVVPVADFELFAQPTAVSVGVPQVAPVLHTPEATRGKFDLGSFVQYDRVEHIVIGQIAVS
jgi:hypothetical protein